MSKKVEWSEAEQAYVHKASGARISREEALAVELGYKTGEREERAAVVKMVRGMVAEQGGHNADFAKGVLLTVIYAIEQGKHHER